MCIGSQNAFLILQQSVHKHKSMLNNLHYARLGCFEIPLFDLLSVEEHVICEYKQTKQIREK